MALVTSAPLARGRRPSVRGARPLVSKSPGLPLCHAPARAGGGRGVWRLHFSSAASLTCARAVHKISTGNRLIVPYCDRAAMSSDTLVALGEQTVTTLPSPGQPSAPAGLASIPVSGSFTTLKES